MRTTSQALTTEPKLGRQSHKVPREVLRSPVAPLGSGVYILGLSMISFETYIEISVDDLDLLYSGFFYIQETGSWTSVDSAQQQILHGVI